MNSTARTCKAEKRQFSLLDGAHGERLKILDAGCGPGIFLVEVLGGHSVVGLDF
jgi:ribosomal protein L11 methylase PrmA